MSIAVCHPFLYEETGVRDAMQLEGIALGY